MHELSSPAQNTEIVDSNPTWGMYVCVYLFCPVRAGSGFTTG
jgi:hypothetical protein